MVGLAKKIISDYAGGRRSNERHTQTCLLERAADLAFQERLRQRREQYFCKTIFMLALKVLLKSKPRLPPPDKDVICANLGKIEVRNHC